MATVVATVVAAWIRYAGTVGGTEQAKTGTGQGAATLEPEPSPAKVAASASVSMSSLTEAPATPPAKTYVFIGTASNLAEDARIHVIIEAPGQASAGRSDATPSGRTWRVSPEAELLADGHWKITWVLPRPASHREFVAVVIRGWSGTPTSACEQLPIGRRYCPPGFHVSVAQVREALRRGGIHTMGVEAWATAPGVPAPTPTSLPWP